jgi:hypothetical protein
MTKLTLSRLIYSRMDLNDTHGTFSQSLTDLKLEDVAPALINIILEHLPLDSNLERLHIAADDPWSHATVKLPAGRLLSLTTLPF